MKEKIEPVKEIVDIVYRAYRQTSSRRNGRLPAVIHGGPLPEYLYRRGKLPQRKYEYILPTIWLKL